RLDAGRARGPRSPSPRPWMVSGPVCLLAFGHPCPDASLAGEQLADVELVAFVAADRRVGRVADVDDGDSAVQEDAGLGRSRWADVEQVARSCDGDGLVGVDGDPSRAARVEGQGLAVPLDDRSLMTGEQKPHRAVVGREALHRRVPAVGISRNRDQAKVTAEIALYGGRRW